MQVLLHCESSLTRRQNKVLTSPGYPLSVGIGHRHGPPPPDAPEPPEDDCDEALDDPELEKLRELDEALDEPDEEDELDDEEETLGGALDELDDLLDDELDEPDELDDDELEEDEVQQQFVRPMLSLAFCPVYNPMRLRAVRVVIVHPHDMDCSAWMYGPSCLTRYHIDFRTIQNTANHQRRRVN